MVEADERYVWNKSHMVSTFKAYAWKASSINERFLERSYVYSTRYTEHIGKYNYNQKLIVFYYYDGKIYVTGDYTIIKELDSHGFVRDGTLEIPVLDK